MMARRIRAVQYGCGPIGCSVATLAAKRSGVVLVGAVDVDPAKVGKDLGEVAGLGEKMGVVVSADAAAVFRDAKPDIVFHTTSSQVKRVFNQVADIAKAGINVVSTCEELSFPYRREPRLASDLDRVAKENNVSVLATGINPGFLMDTWPLFMTGVCQEVTHIKAIRVQDASPRRLPFQKKIGAGCTPKEFQELVDEGTLRHVGLPESIAMIAAGLGWELEEVTEEIMPVMAEEEVSSQYLTVKRGQVAGVRQVGRGIVRGREAITMEFQAYIGAPQSYDAVEIKGTPNMNVVIKGGTHGDVATAAIVVNAASRVVEAPPGLLTMKDMPLVMCSAGWVASR